ncbi:HNH endonuclease [Priestia megaterium]|uniref:HNH endonuclease n=1 Tax=Priestia megaterium TaxID=1404 RepID=UPI003BFA71E4
MFDEVRSVSKPQHKRNKPKGKQRGKFSQETIRAIYSRDNGRCVKCGTSRNLETIPHHITYRSQLGKGEKRNGCVICIPCHRWVHDGQLGPNGEPSAEGRYWFEHWRDENLDENGDMRNDTI